MITFYDHASPRLVYAVQSETGLPSHDVAKLQWLFGGAPITSEPTLNGPFTGPRREMITPWSTNAVEITQNMGISGIRRIEVFKPYDEATGYDPMLSVIYPSLDEHIFTVEHQPLPVLETDDIAAFNAREGLALSPEEISYLEEVSEKLGRKLTDSEVFGFSQVNSEHCRHKIFNGTFVIDGKEQPLSLFDRIKQTSKANPNYIVSAYKDNVAFVKGSKAVQFAPATPHKPDFFEIRDFEAVFSLKAETHNFPTTVEPFNGAATGSGGEIRDRLAGGKGSLPLAGTAVYMTAYPRPKVVRQWEGATPERPWRYQTPLDILIKASDGASDFGNKFGQPLIAGSVLTFEHTEGDKTYGFDKVIMLAGGIGFGKLRDSLKDKPKTQDRIVVLGGDNYRIGMGGSAVSSVATGELDNSIELNAVQRSNPEMQKRVMNTIRAMQERDQNPIVSIHDHGAGGHLNCLSELVEETGGTIDIKKLPVGDPTLSDKEIVGNESQERMGLVMSPKDVQTLREVADRERAPMYDVGEVTGDGHLKFENKATGKNPIDWALSHMFGSSPKTLLEDRSVPADFSEITYSADHIETYLKIVLQLEAVACKDWLTNKVDRSVSGKVATQQTCGKIQLPLNNLGVMAIDYVHKTGVATSVGHAPVAALIDPGAGSRLSVAEALTNLVWAPLTHGLKGVSLSANWMWPAKNEGENARLYAAVEALSEFVQQLSINIPTGKDSLSMVQKYPDGKTVFSPGTVIISSVAEVSDITRTVEPVLKQVNDSELIYINFSDGAFALGGSSFAQMLNRVGERAPDAANASDFKNAFEQVQQLINQGRIMAGHDVSAGGLITTLLEMCFPNTKGGMAIDLNDIAENDLVKILFSEQPAIVVQAKAKHKLVPYLQSQGVEATLIGRFTASRLVSVHKGDVKLEFETDALRSIWMHTSFLLDRQQNDLSHARRRYLNYGDLPLKFRFPKHFDGSLAGQGIAIRRTTKTGVKAAIIREKGGNGDREMAWAMHLAGFDVKDVHMTDLTSGREDLSDVRMIAFVGGFSNSDVLGSAKGWAGAFLYNEKAKTALQNFYAREDTLSLGVCNGCQLMMELELLYPGRDRHPKMQHNESGKFESAFVNLDIPENHSVMFRTLAGSRLGVWLAHGEGRFVLPDAESSYRIVSKYSYRFYPANPNGSDYSAAALCSDDGRHLAIMPHIERSLYPHNWALYPTKRSADEISPWVEAFVNARKWVVGSKQ